MPEQCKAGVGCGSPNSLLLSLEMRRRDVLLGARNVRVVKVRISECAADGRG